MPTQRAEERVEAAPSVGRTNKYSWCEPQILEAIIKPYLIGLIERHKPASKVELLREFRESSGYEACSQSTLDGWLRDCEITTERTLTFSYPQMKIPYDEFAAPADSSAGGEPSGPPATERGSNPGGLKIPGFNV